MPKMSYEGLVGVVIALIVVILDQAGIKNPYVLWVAFALACGLCLDATLRSGWNRRAKGWGSAAIVLSFAFFAAYLVHQLYSKPKRDEAKQGLQEDKKPNQGNPPSTEAPVVKPIPLAKPLKRPAVAKGNSIEVPNPASTVQHPETVINAPQGIGISGGQVTNPTVNNYGPPPLPTPTVTVCVSHPQQNQTAITVRTDVQITRPWFFFFFDAAVEKGTFTMDNHAFGCNCPMRAEKLPNPERSTGFRLTSIDMAVMFGFRGTVRSKQL